MPKNTEKLIKALIGVENNTRLGKYNAMWCRYTFLVWFISLAGSFSLSCTPVDPTNILKGFSLKFGDNSPIWMTVALILTAIICPVGLLICYNKGWIDKEDF
jgi:hypothetical protein